MKNIELLCKKVTFECNKCKTMFSLHIAFKNELKTQKCIRCGENGLNIISMR